MRKIIRASMYELHFYLGKTSIHAQEFNSLSIRFHKKVNYHFQNAKDYKSEYACIAFLFR